MKKKQNPPTFLHATAKNRRKKNANSSSGIPTTEFSTHVRASQLFPPEPIRLGLCPLSPGLTSHDDEGTESPAAIAEGARDVASRPSVRAITFKPHCRLTRRAPRRRRARSLDVLTCASAPALRVKGRAATRLPSGSEAL